MKSDVIIISNDGQGMDEALTQAEKVAEYKGVSPKCALHLRLLTEEMLGMMRSITGERTGKFWIEDQDDEYQLHLRVNTRLTSERREQLLSASTSGKNESAKGLMGRLRDFFDWGSDGDLAYFSSPLLMPEMMEHSSSPALDLEWSMMRYENSLAERIQTDAAAMAAWDELEKSVVKHVADDVKVSIRSGVVEMIIVKKMA